MIFQASMPFSHSFSGSRQSGGIRNIQATTVKYLLTFETLDTNRIIGVESTNSDGSTKIELCGNNAVVTLTESKQDRIEYRGGTNSNDDFPPYNSANSSTTRPYLLTERNGILGGSGVPIIETRGYLGFERDTSGVVTINVGANFNANLPNNNNRYIGRYTPENYGVHYTPQSNFDDDKSGFLGTPYDVSFYGEKYTTDMNALNMGQSITTNRTLGVRHAKLYGVYVTKDKDGAITYINGGALPKDAKMEKIDDEPTPEPDEPHDEDRDGNDEYDSNELNSPTNPSACICGGLHYYYMNRNNLKDFYDWFNLQGTNITAILQQAFNGVYSNLTECIVGLKYFEGLPTNIASGFDLATIKLGFLNTNISASEIDSLPAVVQHYGQIKLEKKFNTFYDYSPYTSVQMYLPYVGTFDLDVDIWMGHNIDIYYAVDITSGMIKYFLMLDDTLIDTKSGTYLIDVPFTLANSVERTSSLIQSDLSKIGVGMSTADNPIGALGGIMTPPTPTHFGGSLTSGDFTSTYMPRFGYLITKRPVYNRPSGYGSHIGFPLYKSKYLGGLNGYTVCQNARIGDFQESHYPTSEEYDEIISILNGGVII